MNRKGQAALEFMMTYGWAILVVLAAIGALSYFGVLDPGRLTPETCVTSSGWGCLGKPVTTVTPAPATDTVAFSISNGVGYDVTLIPNIVAVTATFNDVNICPTADLEAHICPIGNADVADDPTTPAVEGPCFTDASAGMVIPYAGSATIYILGCDFSNVKVVKGDVTMAYRNPQSQLEEQITFSLTGKPKA